MSDQKETPQFDKKKQTRFTFRWSLIGSISIFLYWYYFARFIGNPQSWLIILFLVSILLGILIVIWFPGGPELKTYWKIDNTSQVTFVRNKFDWFILSVVFFIIALFPFLKDLHYEPPHLFWDVILFGLPILLLVLVGYRLYKFFFKKVPFIPLLWDNPSPAPNRSMWLNKPVQYFAIALLIFAFFDLLFFIFLIFKAYFQ